MKKRLPKLHVLKQLRFIARETPAKVEARAKKVQLYNDRIAHSEAVNTARAYAKFVAHQSKLAPGLQATDIHMRAKAAYKHFHGKEYIS